jgi:putative DNA primase/helicase
MNKLLDAALGYAARGWQVFPCWWAIGDACACGGNAGCSPGKHPLTAHGLKDATTDAAQIRAWWAKYPEANVAIRTGAESGLVVVDLDVKPDKDGRASFRVLNGGAVDRTAMTRTGGGGLHLYYRHPGFTVRNSQNELGPGIDVRGDQGYVLAPPSNHVSGRVYEWA